MNIRKFIRFLLTPFYLLLNVFLFPFVKIWFFYKIGKLERKVQLFFLTRTDLGPCLLLMHYAECWAKERGPASLVVFTANAQILSGLYKVICPNVNVIAFENIVSKLITLFFKKGLYQHFTLNPIYASACCRWPYTLYLSDTPFSITQKDNVSCYIPQMDPFLEGKPPFSESFVEAYLNAREVHDHRRANFRDMFKLHYQTARKKSSEPKKDPCQLLENLKIQRPYVVMNLNCKRYADPLRNNRSIQYPERFNALIDFLISKGFSVVAQGRNEQPSLTPRAGYIEYFKSKHATPLNDFKLYANCSFTIMNKTGPEVFAMISNIPVFGVNFIELNCIHPNGRSRFYPKHLWDSKKNEWIHWSDLLKRPCFFDIGNHYYEQYLQYKDMEEEELIESAKEFLAMLDLPAPWGYTPLQKKFKSLLHPMHLDLYDTMEVPLDAYLSSAKFQERSEP